VKVKRTYNLPESTVRRVRELARDYGVSGTQDGVIEKAVERLYVDELARQEAERWADASSDATFRAEIAGIARDFEDQDRWPR
jgi:hypothetical protein